MNILMSFKHHLENKQIIDQLTKLVRDKLSRIINSNDTVRLIFDDINGTRKGIDKSCTLLLVTSKGRSYTYKSIGRNETESLKDAIRKFKSHFN